MKNKIYLRKKICVKCNLLNPKAKDIQDCKNDPGCPATDTELIIGPNPEYMREKLERYIKLSFENDDSDMFKLATTIMQQVDSDLSFEAFKNVMGDLLDESSGPDDDDEFPGTTKDNNEETDDSDDVDY